MLRRPFYFLLLLLCASFSTTEALGQEGDSKGKEKQEKGNAEEELLQKLVKKISKEERKNSETERDQFLKELKKQTEEDFSQATFEDWFKTLSYGQGEWYFDLIAHKGQRELFGRIATRRNLRADSITKAQFLNYAQEFLREGHSPAWRSTEEKSLDEAREVFQQFDKNRDTVLDSNELTPTLKLALKRWDENCDGCIDLSEYGQYFSSRLKSSLAELGTTLHDESAAAPTPQVVRRPAGVHRRIELPLVARLRFQTSRPRQC